MYENNNNSTWSGLENSESQPQPEQRFKPSSGAIWKKNKGKGDYFSGSIEIPDSQGNIVKHAFVAFANRNKKTDKHPDFVIFRNEFECQNLN